MKLIDFCNHICHQLPERSFLWLWNPPLLCARCTGFYAGVVAGGILLAASRGRLARRSVALLAVTGLMTGAEIALEHFAGWHSSNAIRAITGWLFGTAIGIGLLAPLYAYLAKRTIS